jgi:CYTH domain-containing protein
MRIVPPDSRFARPEWERRFLLDRFPVNASVARIRQIADRYIIGTRMRLRRMTDSDGTVAFKLTQKLNHGAAGSFQGQLTTIYLTKEEHSILSVLPARSLDKTRYSVAPFGIDVFTGNLGGLILAEAEFGSAEEAAALEPPGFSLQEVTSDPRFTGGYLSTATRQELIRHLEGFGISLDPP